MCSLVYTCVAGLMLREDMRRQQDDLRFTLSDFIKTFRQIVDNMEHKIDRQYYEIGEKLRQTIDNMERRIDCRIDR